VLPEFLNEPLPVKLEAVKTFEDFVKRMKKHETIRVINRDDNQTKASLYAFTALLRNFQFSPGWRACVGIYRMGGVWTYRYINPNTLDLINSMFKAFYYDTEFEHNYTDSDEAVLFAFDNWEQMTIEFEYDNPKIANILDNVQAPEQMCYREVTS
jgi:hypothetical protein